MARETFAEAQIPAEGKDDVPYADHRAIARALMGRATESMIAQGTGAGGAGFAIVNVPFEPAALLAINQAGAAPALHHSIYSPTPAHTTTILAVAANATPAVITQVADNDWTVTLTTAMAPDAEVVTVLLLGVRDATPGI